MFTYCYKENEKLNLNWEDKDLRVYRRNLKYIEFFIEKINICIYMFICI